MPATTLLRSIFIATVLFSIACHSEENSAGFTAVEDLSTTAILTPSLSERKVLKLRLSSGIDVMIISDPGAEQSAAAVSVEAGAWDDPKEYPGMAHFLEHMLFMGTKAFPSESEYMQYISDNGGKVNAFTASDRTVYMLSVNNTAFEGALDRFSHFFIDPLFQTSCISRELNAVDQEHAKNIQNDLWREYMIFKETGNPDHPNAKFSTGNAKTLSDIPQTALKDWYEKHYSAEKMHLVIISPLPMEKLSTLTLHTFGKVQRKGAKQPSMPMSLCSSRQKGHILYIKPIKDLRRVSVVFELPYQFASVEKRWSAEILAYILSSQGEGSLSSVLKNDHLIDHIQCYCDRYSKDNILFITDIDLTEKGLTMKDDVLDRLFQAIALVKEQGIPSELYEEMKTLEKIKYEYQSRDDAFDIIAEIAYGLVDEPLASYPEKTRIPSAYDPAAVHALTNHLTPQEAIFFVIADPAKTGIETDIKEKWMAAEYTLRQIDDQRLAKLASMSPPPGMTLPKSNPYLPGSLSLQPTLQKEDALAEKIIDSDSAKVFFQQDTRYRVPEIACLFTLKSPLLNGSARSLALADLYLKALGDALSDKICYAQAAGLDVQLAAAGFDLCLSVRGFSDKAPDLTLDVFKQLKIGQINKEKFARYKESLLSSYDNASKELPVRQAMEVISSLMMNNSPTSADKMKELHTLCYDEFTAFSSHLFDRVYTQALLFGNLQKEQALDLWQNLSKQQATTTPYLSCDQIQKNILLLPHQTGPFQIQESTDMQGNGVVLVIEQGPFTFEKRAAQQVLSKAMQEAFFETLRTKQQTGYIAKAWEAEAERQLLQFFAVQSSTHSPTDLLMRFELFIEDFIRNFSTNVSQERFETIKQMLITTLKMPPENMQGMADRMFSLAFDFDADFQFINKRIEALSTLTYEGVKKDLSLFFSRKNQRRLAVLMEGVLPAENDFHYESIAREELTSLGTYISYK